jgi:aspartyl-tRNA(Asn)/glutamyl-tRNA(Gln) amidotransferase subunit B
MRCDVNVSVRRRGDPEPGVRCEVKNVSGFRFVAQAVEAEAARQIEIRQQGEPVLSETRAFDAVRRTTRRLRSKELVPDYRYLPDPDLPALVLSAEQIQAARAALPELPGARRRRWATLGLPAEHALSFAADPELSELFDSAARLNPQRAAAVGDLVKTAVRARIREDRSALARIRPEWLVELAELRAQGQVSSTQQKMLVDRLLDGSSATVAAALVEIGGVQVSDEATLEGWVDAVLAAHPAEVESYRGGKSGLLGFFVGRVMRASGGRADPVATKRRLVARLG